VQGRAGRAKTRKPVPLFPNFLRARRNIGWNRFDLPTSGLDLTMRHIESRAKQAMTFQPGQSGNPGGRRRKSDDDRKVEELARAYGVEAIKTLASIMRSAKAPASARSAAAQAILDRGFGRPRQTQKINPAPRKPIPETTCAATRVGLESPGTSAFH
jgi:hypothetical protein